MSVLEFFWFQIAFSFLVVTFDFTLAQGRRFGFNRVILILLPIIACLVWVEFPHTVYVMNKGVMEGEVLSSFQVWADNYPASFTRSFGLYYLLIGFLILFWRLFRTWDLYGKGQKLSITNGIQVRLTKKPSYSLFNRIFINESDLDNPLIWEHEKFHVTKYHTLDLLWVSMVQSMLWINPLAWRWKVLVIQNHEFEVDQLVAKNNCNSRDYIHLLLDKAFNTQQFSIGNYFSIHSLISKRIAMLNSKRKKPVWKVVSAVMFMLAGSIYISSCGKLSKSEPNSENETIKSTSEIFKKADKMPQFKGGMEALYTYLGKELKYPADCKKEKIEGKVIIAFVVNPKGEIENVRIENPVQKSLDAEALRCIQSMPDWIPGEIDGKPVSVEMRIPVVFKLGNP